MFIIGARALYKGFYHFSLLPIYFIFLKSSLETPLQVLVQYTPSWPSTPLQPQPRLSHAYSKSSKPPKQLLKPSHKTYQASPLISACSYCPVIYHSSWFPLLWLSTWAYELTNWWNLQLKRRRSRTKGRLPLVPMKWDGEVREYIFVYILLACIDL